MHETQPRADIQSTLNQFTDGNFAENVTNLLKVLGYESQRTLNREANTPEAFLEDFDPDDQINTEQCSNNLGPEAPTCWGKVCCPGFGLGIDQIHSLYYI